MYNLRNKIKSIAGFIFADKEDLSLENRLFLSAIIVGILTSVIGSGLNMILSTSITAGIIPSILSALLFILYYFMRFKKMIEPFVIPMIIISQVGISIIWVFNGGINGSNIMPGFVILILGLIIVSEKIKKYIVYLFITLNIIIYLIQLFRPDLIVNFTSETERWVDSIVTLVYTSCFIYLIIRFLHKNYTLERQKFEEIYNSSPIGIGLYDINGTMIEINKSCLEIFGVIDSSEIKKINLFRNSKLNENLMTQLQSGESIRKEINVDFEKVKELKLYDTTRTGNICLDILITPIKTNKIGSNIRYLAHIHDITERKRAEEALKESEEKYRTLIEQTTEGILITDSKGNYVDVNSGVCQMLGYSRDEILSMNTNQLISEDDLKKDVDTIKRLLKGENVITECRLKCKNGIFINAELNVNMLPDGRFCSFVRDITERKRAESESMRIQNLESLGVLISGITHDFRNLLTIIRGQSSIIGIKSQSDDTKKNISGIMEATKTASGLIEQLSGFAVKSIPRKTKIAIRQIIEESAKSVVNGSIDIQFLFEDSLAIEADRGQMTQVIKNIIVNALESMPNGGKLYIKTSDIKENEKPFTKITIKDSGVGIHKQNIDKIFNPYFSTKIRANEKGSGLGLSICHSIIKNHNGKLLIDSQLGVGTTIEIYLPAIPEK